MHWTISNHIKPTCGKERQLQVWNIDQLSLETNIPKWFVSQFPIPIPTDSIRP